MSVAQLGIHLWSANAGANLTGKLFYLAKLDTDGDIVVGTLGSSVIGPITEEATSGNPATVQMSGIAKVILGATLDPGTRVASDATGKAIAAVTDEFEIGTLLTGGQANEIATMMIMTGRARSTP